jgi:hypothetical protein
MQIDADEARKAHEIKLKEMDGDIIIGKAQIESDRFMKAQDVNENKIPDTLEVAKLKQEQESSFQDVKENQKDREQESKEKEKDREVKREELKAKIQIAKANKNKPKTS